MPPSPLLYFFTKLLRNDAYREHNKARAMTQRLFTPGPVRVPPEILAAAAEPPLYHRSDEFRVCSQRVWTNLKKVFKTANPVAVLAGSGMTGIEAAITSTLRRGESAIVLVHGRFGERIAHIMRIHGVTPHVIEVPWGETIKPEAVVTTLKEFPNASALWMVHGETSTGVALDVEAIALAVRAECAGRTERAASSQTKDILICVDAIASLAIHPLETDAWSLDIVVAGIQKGLMCPPGLVCVSVSPRALERVVDNDIRTYTLDLQTVLAHQEKGLFTWTPPVTLVRALDVALNLVLLEGLPNVWQRHADVSRMLQEGVRDRGLSVFGDGTSHAVTPVVLANANTFRQRLLQRHAIVIANGQDHLSGTLVRIGTCGSITRRDILELFNAIDDVLPLLKP